MFNLDLLENRFQKSSILRLAEIFEAASSNPDDADKLNADLRSVLQGETGLGILKWEASPGGNNHIILTDSQCFLINPCGIHLLFKNWLIYDGEMWVRNFQWFEDDNLVVFDVDYIVHRKSQKCICHYSKDGFFCYFSAADNSTPSELDLDEILSKVKE